MATSAPPSCHHTLRLESARTHTHTCTLSRWIVCNIGRLQPTLKDEWGESEKFVHERISMCDLIKHSHESTIICVLRQSPWHMCVHSVRCVPSRQFWYMAITYGPAHTFCHKLSHVSGRCCRLGSSCLLLPFSRSFSSYSDFYSSFSSLCSLISCYCCGCRIFDAHGHDERECSWILIGLNFN